jgi:hypothetical protein
MARANDPAQARQTGVPGQRNIVCGQTIFTLTSTSFCNQSIHFQAKKQKNEDPLIFLVDNKINVQIQI